MSGGQPKGLYYSDESIELWHGDALETLSRFTDGSVDCCVTSPPYFGLRDYGIEGQYGLEPSPAAYVETMRAVFAEVRRVLADDGTLWLNIGDSYASTGGKSGVGPNALVGSTLRQATKRTRPVADLPAKNLLGIPWHVAFALQEDGWILRNAIVWHKPNAMPESVTDRLSNRYEPLFMFSKKPRYWFDLNPIRVPLADPAESHQTWARETAKERAIPNYHAQKRPGRTWEERKASGEPMRYGTARQQAVGKGGFVANEDGRNPGDVWEISTRPFSAAHFAVMPPALAERCIQAGCKPDGIALDPFSGSGTTGAAAAKLGRRYVGIDLNADYLELSLKTRLAQTALIEGAS